MAAITINDDAWKVIDSVDSPTYYLDLKAMRKSIKSPLKHHTHLMYP